MRAIFPLALCLALCPLLPKAALAQTLYNAPGEQTAAPAPLNWRQLFHRGQEAEKNRAPARIPYASTRNDEMENFAQRKSLLDQWRAQRDAQAQAKQSESTNYMAALAQSDSPSTFGMSAAPPRAAPAAPVPMIYRKKDDAGIQKPRRLFNSLQ